jgi:hypothetical protein
MLFLALFVPNLTIPPAQQVGFETTSEHCSFTEEPTYCQLNFKNLDFGQKQVSIEGNHEGSPFVAG